VVECEIEAGEVEGPSGLPPVQLLGRHEVLQILVVRPDLALMFRAFDKVPPLLEGSDDCQHLLVVDLVVPFDRGQGLGEEGDRALEEAICSKCAFRHLKLINQGGI